MVVTSNHSVKGLIHILTLMRKFLTIHKVISCSLSKSNFVGLSIVSRRIVA